jgi:hypothetical protein
MYAQLSQPPPPLTSRRPDLPAAVDQVFARALAKIPGDRYASCREFADAMRAAFGLASYDSGPEPILPLGHLPAAEQPAAAEHPPAAKHKPAVHPPAGPAQPTAGDDVPAPGPAAPLAQPAPPAPSARLAPPAPPVLSARLAPPARHAAATPPGPSAPDAPPTLSVRPAAFGRPGSARRRRSRRAILAALAALLVLAAAAIGAYILQGRLSSRALATTPIATASRIAPAALPGSPPPSSI